MSQMKIFPNQIRTRLLETDLARFKHLIAMRDTNEAQFAREAILFYMQSLEQGHVDQTESTCTKQIKASTNRICALLSKVAMDVRAIYFYIGEENREGLQKYRQMAAKTISKALTPEERAVSDLMSQQSVSKDEPTT